MSEEETPLNNERMAAMDHYALREVRMRMSALQNEVRSYRDEAVKSNAKLDQHVESCGQRYAELRGEPPPPKDWWDWLGRKLIDKAFDYGLIVIVLGLYFAFTHGFHPPHFAP